MSTINSVNLMDSATRAAIPSMPEAQTPDGDSITAFNKLLFAGTPQGDVGGITPPQMLVQQASILGTTVGVDLGAKVAGAVSQAVNKLVNIT